MHCLCFFAANDTLLDKKWHKFQITLSHNVLATADIRSLEPFFQIPAEVKNVIFKLSIIKDYLQHNYISFMPKAIVAKNENDKTVFII